jgi:hypothetical protein
MTADLDHEIFLASPGLRRLPAPDHLNASFHHVPTRFDNGLAKADAAPACIAADPGISIYPIVWGGAGRAGHPPTTRGDEKIL